MRTALLALALAGCAGDSGDGWGNVDAGAGDAGPTCGLAITFDPAEPIASSTTPIRAYTNVQSVPGVIMFTWAVRFNGTQTVSFTSAAADNSQINFVAVNPGVYYVDVSITNSPLGCSQFTGILNVAAPGANMQPYRLRTIPPASLAPPQESVVIVKGGADLNRSIALDPGTSWTGSVRDNQNQGVQAYMKFMPVATPNSYVEAFSQSTGVWQSRLLNVDHDVLVIPTSTALAPRIVGWTINNPVLVVQPGTLVTGTVRAPNGTGLGGAKVQLYTGALPSTLATTAADGTFSLRADFAAGATITAKVTPPATSGLPRLEASGTFNLASAMTINYASSLASCDLASTPVRRSASSLANAKVSVVGAMATAGTVNGTNARGIVLVTATSDGTGRLPTMLVPRAILSAVTETATDHAISGIDTSTCSLTSIDAPAPVVVSGMTKNVSAQPLAGVRVEATPIGNLALAGVLPVQTISTATGTFNLPLSTAGRYDVRFLDPMARAAPLVLLGITAASVPSTATLPKALTISGDVHVVNSTNPVIGASIQILCATCTGLDAVRPIAETATDTLSQYRIAVPDPGTM